MSNKNGVDLTTTGGRIRYLRECRAKEERSQDAVAGELGVKRQTLAKWEQNKADPSVGDLRNMCELFGCDPGYLLLEYSCKKRPTTDIHDVTGLSERAIERLEALSILCPDVVDVISAFILSPVFQTSIQELLMAVRIKEEDQKKEAVIKDLKKQFGPENDASFKELLHAALPDMNDFVLEKAVGTRVEMAPDEMAKFYYMAAKDSFSDAVSDLYKAMIQRKTK